MKNEIALLALATAMLMSPAPAAAAVTQVELDRLAAEIDVRFAVQNNRPGNCPGGQPGCFV